LSRKTSAWAKFDDYMHMFVGVIIHTSSMGEILIE
jgi:hypothetical protein